MGRAGLTADGPGLNHALKVLRPPIPCCDAVPLNDHAPFVSLTSCRSLGFRRQFWDPVNMVLLSVAGGRSPLFTLAVSAGAMIVFIFGFMAWQSPSRIPFTRQPPHMSETYVESKTTGGECTGGVH
jgi:hypothetical protein